MMYVVGFIVLSAFIQVPLLRFGPRGIHVAALVLVGAGVSVLVYQALAYVRLGFLDPFFLVAAAVEFGIALLVGAVAAFFMRREAKPST
jgi:hypothetical protein